MAKVVVLNFLVYTFGLAGIVSTDNQCPESNGKFISPTQCDAYIECVDGVAEEKLCPDGLLFTQRNQSDGDCTFAPLSSCKERSVLQPAQPTDDCPRQFGFFRIGSESECGEYKNCAHGEATISKCPEGLAFNPETYRCDWPDLVVECNAEAFLGFTCPPPHVGSNANNKSLSNNEAEIDTEDGILSAFHKPDDCKKYFVCVNGHPRLYSCGKYLYFNQETGMCDFYTRVKECYKKKQLKN